MADRTSPAERLSDALDYAVAMQEKVSLHLGHAFTAAKGADIDAGTIKAISEHEDASYRAFTALMALEKKLREAGKI